MKDGFKYYVLIKNNADETYSHMNAYGIDSSYRLILKKGYSFAIYTLKVGATVQELKQAVKLELSYIPTNGTITTAENLDSNFKAGQVSLNASQYGKHTVVNPYWYKRYLLEEFQGKIDVKLNTEVIDNKEINGKIIYATVRNTKTGVIKNIYADYFVDCTADCYLLRANKELGKDYFIGSDSKALYNESAYVDGYIGDKYGINAYEICYYYGNPQYNKLSSDDRISKITDINKIESIPGVVSGTNGNFAICRGINTLNLLIVLNPL